MNSKDAVQFGVFFKLVYTLFLRDVLVKAVGHSKNTIDDKALEMIDLVAFGDKGI